MNFIETIFEILTKNNLFISVAESVTGGMLASSIVANEGASRIFKGGVITYTNESKEKVLNVKKNTLDNFGAVSMQTAREMVIGVAKLFDTSLAISVTGIANGSIENKPSGLVYFCFLIEDIVYSYEAKFDEPDRQQNRIAMTSKIISEFAKLLLKTNK